MIVQTDGNTFLFILKSKVLRDVRFNRPIVVSGGNVTSLPNASVDSKVRSYFLSNNIQTSLPLIQYKFPLSEHTEAG
jgi:hypothetical protein